MMFCFYKHHTSFIMNNNKKTREEFLKGKKLISGGIKGMHKIFSVDKYPAYYANGNGCYVYDLDGNEYIDFVMGKGPYILGYKNETVDNAVIEQIHKGNIFPMGNPYHNMVAEKILSCLPAGERVVFYKSGSCATSAAIRLARAYTEREIILSCGYHGWHDWCNGGKGVLKSVEDAFYDFKFNLELFDEYCERYRGNIAAVIISPEEFYLDKEFYEYIQMVCNNNGILFILDEVKTGFRVSVGGFQGKYGLNPDMSTFSKAMSNGYSISALVGKKKYLDINEEIHTAGTYDTEVISFAASYECLSVIEELNVPQIVDRYGTQFVGEVDALFRKYNVGLYPIWSNGSFRIWSEDYQIEEAFYTQMAEQYVLFYAFDNSYISLAHTENVMNETLNRVEKVLKQGTLKQDRRFETIDKKLFGESLKNKKGFLDGYVGAKGRKE